MFVYLFKSIIYSFSILCKTNSRKQVNRVDCNHGNSMVKMMTRFSVHVYLILNVFICKGVTVVADIDCDFDMNFCDWQQDVMDDFNWTKGLNGYLNTGPSYDHTKREGYYIYVDLYNNDKGEIARLMSPLQSSGQHCLTFWYSMYGRDIGALNVYIKMKDENETVIFSKSKDIGVPNWWKSVLNINAYDSYQIVFEGIIGDGYIGDIAIDDISIRSGSCSIDCDFDDDFCNWMQYHGDDFNWDRMKGETYSRNTGPSADHTSGHGYYTYIETSYRNEHDKTILLSPTLNAGKYCLSFWYYMYGSGIDRLRLQMWQRNGTKQTISTVQSEQGQQWFHKWELISSKDMFKIAFEGRVKKDKYYIRSKGDIAIDDVTLFSCNDCNDPRPSHSVANSTNYEYGSVIEIQCKHGYSIEGESVIVCEVMGLWSGGATCIPHDVETNSSPLIVVYVLIPVVFLMIAATFTVLYLRRRHLSCRKVLKSFKRAREVPSGDLLQEQSHSNQMYNDEDLQLDDEYATISGEQTDDKQLGTNNYSTDDRSGIKKLGLLKGGNQAKSTDGKTFPCNIDVNECNTYNVLSVKALNKSLKGSEKHDLEYDNACTRQMKNEASNNDDYSHIGDLEMKYQHTQHFLPQPDIWKNTDYSHIDRVSTSTKFPECFETDYHDYEEYQREEEGTRKTPKNKQLEDQALDYYKVVLLKKNSTTAKMAVFDET